MLLQGDDIGEELEGFRGEVFQSRCRVNRRILSRGHSGMVEVGKDKPAHDRHGDLTRRENATH
jgi:hypothetical protein